MTEKKALPLWWHLQTVELSSLLGEGHSTFAYLVLVGRERTNTTGRKE